VVEAQKAAKAIATDHLSGAVHVGVPRDQGVVDPLVVPFLAIVLHELARRRFLAICSIHAPPGFTAIPKISTLLLAISIANSTW
jgi:hypothetical protein